MDSFFNTGWGGARLVYKSTELSSVRISVLTSLTTFEI